MDKEQEAFLRAYKIAVKNFIARYKQEDDPQTPTMLMYTRNFDYDRFAEMPACFSAMADGIRRLNEEYHSLYIAIQAVNSDAQREMQAWFDVHGYDPDWPKPIEHDTQVHIVKNWVKPCPEALKKRLLKNDPDMTFPRAVDCFKRAIKVGQVYITEQPVFQGYKTYTLWEGVIGYEMDHFTWSFRRENKQEHIDKLVAYAQKLSCLAQWNEIDTMTGKQKRSLQEAMILTRKECEVS